MMPSTIAISVVAVSRVRTLKRKRSQGTVPNAADNSTLNQYGTIASPAEKLNVVEPLQGSDIDPSHMVVGMMYSLNVRLGCARVKPTPSTAGIDPRLI